MATKTITTCDICSGEGASPAAVPVVFLTEQTEGTRVKPYLQNLKIDICSTCMDWITNIRQIPLASGAQGNNKIWFEKPVRHES
jgi:hypothetical protein